MPRWPSSASPLSRGSQRYLPRRRTASIRWPVSAAANPAGPRGSRRTGRGWRTVTDSTVRPTTWRSRPSRTVSTSGSSGTASVGQGQVGLDAEGDRELAVRRLRGGLLGLLLGAGDAVAVAVVTDAYLGGEGLQVVGALVLDEVLGHTEAVLGGELLERGLPVEAGAHRRGRHDQRVEQQVDDLGGALEAAGEVDRPDHRLDGVGQDRRLLAASGGVLAAAELDVGAEPDRAADAGQRAGIDDRRAELGQMALGEVGVGAVEGLGDDDAEHGVAEELEALVGRQAAVLVGVRAVREGAL